MFVITASSSYANCKEFELLEPVECVAIGIAKGLEMSGYFCNESVMVVDNETGEIVFGA